MRHRILLLSLAITVVTATTSSFNIPITRAAEEPASSNQPSQAELRYGTSDLALSNGLSADEFYARFIELRDQGKAQSNPPVEVRSSSGSARENTVTGTAANNPPTVSEVRASQTTNWMGLGTTVQNMGAAEEIYMAWPDDRDSTGDAALYFTRSLDGGQTWSTDKRVDRSGSTPGEVGLGIDMAADNHGNIVLVWYDDRNGTGTGQLFYATSHDQGDTWSSAVPVDPDSELSLLPGLDLTVDPAGNFYVAWQDLRPGLTAFGIYTASSFDRGDTWETEKRVNDTTGTVELVPRITATRDRDIVVQWLSDRSGDEDDVFVARSTDGGMTYTPDKRINSNGAGSLSPTNNKLCTDGNGNVYVIYALTSPDTFIGDVYAVVSNDFGANWTVHKKIPGGRFLFGFGTGLTALNCMYDGINGQAVVAFSGSSTGSDDEDVFVSVSSDSGSTWKTAKQVKHAPAGFSPQSLSTGIDGFGHVVTAWNDGRSTTSEIYYNYSNSFGDTWQSDDARLNGGTPGTHTAMLTDETFVFIGNFSLGNNGTNNTERLAFHSTFNDDRASAPGMYDGIIEFTGDMQVLTRLSGDTRIQTSIEINRDLFPVAGTSPAVVVATSQDFADGLAAGPLAAMLNGSLVLNPQDTLHTDVALEISRVLDFKASPAVNVYVVGGPAAISDDVIAQIQAISPHVRIRRVSGENRYVTAIRVAEEMDDIRGSGPTGAMMTTGENFPDALSASSPASDAGINPGQMPILLVTSTTLPPEVTNYLIASEPTLQNLYAIGGTAAVSEAVTDSAVSYLPSIVFDRLAGPTRYETATAVAAFFYTDAMAPQGIGLASGEKFPDALGGGRASGAKHRPLILTTKSTLPSTSSDYLTANAGTLDTGDVYGGTAVIDDAIVSQINVLI